MLLDTVSKQLKKGVIEVLILKLLSNSNMYGYQIIQELDEKSSGVFKMKEGTLYPILYRLEDGNLIESYWEQEQEKRRVPRKYYRITNTGSAELKNMQNELITLIKSINSILNLWEGIL